MSNKVGRYIWLLLIFIGLRPLFAQNRLRIEAKIANMKPTMLVLAQHYGGQLIPIDTAIVGSDGRVVWEDSETIPAGMCRILGIGRGVDIVVADSQQFAFEADAKDFIATIHFTKSPENTLFFNYQREARRHYLRALAYRQQMGIQDDNDPRWKTRYQELNDDIKKHVDSLYQKHPESFAVHFLKSYQEPKLPVLPLKQLSAKDSAYLQSYAWEHFFDNCSLSDERMAFTPTLPARLERFLKTLSQYPKEKLESTIDNLIQKTNGTVELRKYIVGKLAQQFELTPNPIFDDLYKHVTEKYVANESNIWDASTLQKIKEISAIKDKLAIGNTFPSMPLTDVAGTEKLLESLECEYTVVFFYDPGCSHCRETTPKLIALARQNSHRMKVYAVSLDATPTSLINFIREFKTDSFINVCDASQKIEFYKLGVINYPTIYLLDRDKKIVGRWLNVEQLANYFVSR